MKIAVSFLKSDNYKKCIEKINASKADYIHVDMCDGKYVEEKNFVLSDLLKTLKVASKPLDVHMMVNNPLKYIDSFAFYDTEYITIHLNSCKDLNEVIDYISSIGIKVGIAINPDEEISLLEPYLDKIDKVLIMSVVPGKGGQEFMESVISKIDELNELKDKYHFITSIDGGINDETIKLINDKNIDLVVSGSYITNQEDYNEAIKSLK